MKKSGFRYKSAFDIIGPIMIGPSSSHTAGAVKIGKMAREIFKRKPAKLVVTFYGSFAETYKGHGTAVAIVAGILGFETSDERIPEALELAKEAGIYVELLVSQKEVAHANTANLVLVAGESQLDLTAVSIGGGSIQLTEINHLSTVHSPSSNGLIVLTTVAPTMGAALGKVVKDPSILTVQQLGQETVLFVETVSDINGETLAKLKGLPGATTVLATES